MFVPLLKNTKTYASSFTFILVYYCYSDSTRWLADDAPLFRVSKIYKTDTTKRVWFQGPSSTSAWIKILQLLNTKKKKLNMKLGATTVSGPNMFGLDNDNLRALIESQEESLTCATYVHAFLREQKKPKKRGPQQNPASSKPGGKQFRSAKRTKVSAAELINIGEGDFKVDEDGALLELPAGWAKQIKMREQGATAGQRDTYFIDPNGKRYRSVVEGECARCEM